MYSRDHHSWLLVCDRCGLEEGRVRRCRMREGRPDAGDVRVHWRADAQAEGGVPEMSDLSEAAEHIMEIAKAAGATDFVAEAEEAAVRQVRFSNSEVDVVNSWSEKHLVLFVAVGKKVMSSDIRVLDDIDGQARELVALAKKVPPSKTYGGIASGRFKYRRGGVDANIVGGTFFAIHDRVGIASSGGALGTDEGTAANLSVRAFSQPEASGHAVC